MVFRYRASPVPDRVGKVANCHQWFSFSDRPVHQKLDLFREDRGNAISLPSQSSADSIGAGAAVAWSPAGYDDDSPPRAPAIMTDRDGRRVFCFGNGRMFTADGRPYL